MTKPMAIGIVERRRTSRRRLRKGATVALHGIGTDAGAFYEGVLLNLSLNGLACRLTSRPDGALREGESVRTVFRVSRTSEPFDLSARIVNITEGGEPDHWIVGLEFTGPGLRPSDRKRLEDAIQAESAREE